MSPDPGVDWTLFENEAPVLTLKQVAMYKYLGTWTFGSMKHTTTYRQDQCVKTARKYKGCCIYVSKDGPDVVDVILCTWSNVAIPSILFGCEMLPFSEEAIASIERIQSTVLLMFVHKLNWVGLV